MKIRYDLTSLNQVPALVKYLDSKNLLAGSTILDIGAGRWNKTREFMKARSISYHPYDPYCLPEDVNQEFIKLKLTKRSRPKIIVSNVLCVIPEQHRRNFLDFVRKTAIEKSSQALFNLDIYFSIYEGDKSGVGKLTSKNTWQNNMLTEKYLPEIGEYFSNVELIKKNIIRATFPIEE